MSFRAKSSERGIFLELQSKRDSSEDLGMTVKNLDYFFNCVFTQHLQVGHLPIRTGGLPVLISVTDSFQKSLAIIQV